MKRFRYVERLKKIMQHEGLNQREVAKKINRSEANLVYYLKQDSRCDPEAFEAALDVWWSREGLDGVATDTEEVTQQWLPTGFIATKASMAIVESCNYANEYKSMVAVVGPPGAGKTSGVREFQRQARIHEIRFSSISANCMTTPAHLMRKIADDMRLNSKGAAAVITDRIVAKLRREPAVVIVDEAQHLNVRCLEALRCLYDESGCGLALIGSFALYRTLTDGDESHYELQQLQDRIADIKTVGVLDHAGVTKFVSSWLGLGDKTLDAELISRFRAKTKGNPRRLERLIKTARKISDERGGIPITVELIEAAEKRLFQQESETLGSENVRTLKKAAN